MLSAVLVASIAVAVILGYKTKINTGFFCIACTAFFGVRIIHVSGVTGGKIYGRQIPGISQ